MMNYDEFWWETFDCTLKCDFDSMTKPWSKNFPGDRSCATSFRRTPCAWINYWVFTFNTYTEMNRIECRSFSKKFFFEFFFWKHFAYQTFFAFHCVSNKILHSQPYTENTGMPLEAKTWISMLWISFRRHFFLHYYLKNTDSYGVYTSLWCQYDDLSPLYTHFGAVEIVSDLFFDTKSQQYFQKYNSSKFNSLKIFKDQYLWENFTDLYKLNLI